MAKKKKAASTGNALKKPPMARPPKSAPFQASPAKKPDYVILSALGITVALALAILYFSLSPGKGAAGQPAAPKGQQPPQAPQHPASQQVKVSASNYDSAHFQGNASADIVLVEYGDFECPYCQQALSTLADVRQSHPEIEFAYRHYPLEVHPGAEKAAEAAECAGAQGKFWEMHDLLFASQGALSVPSLKGYAGQLSLDSALFNSCLDSGSMAALVAAQQQEGRALGVSATPTFLVFSRKGAGNAALAARVGKEVQTLFSRYSSYNLPVGAASVEGAGTGMLFAGALPYSDFEEVLGAFK